MSLTPVALNRFAAQEISALTSCEAPVLSDEFTQADHWVNNFILNTMFHTDVNIEYKPHIFGFLRRAQMSLVEYENGRLAVLDYLGGEKERLSVYFKGLYHFEIVVTLLYQAYDIVRLLRDEDLYKSGDGTPIERLNTIYNVTKHLEPSTIPKGFLHAVWLTNDGISTGRASISWTELSEQIKDIGRTADEMSNPSKYAKNDA